MKNGAILPILTTILAINLVSPQPEKTNKLDIDRVLPKTIPAMENPMRPPGRHYLPSPYSPQQKAKLVGLMLKSF